MNIESTSSLEHERLSQWLLELYENDPHPAVHAAAAWLLSRWGQQSSMIEVDQRLATGDVVGKRRWYLCNQGDTMLVVPRGEIGAHDHFGQPKPIRVDEPFAIGAYEVTVAQFRRYRPDHVVDIRSTLGDDSPVNEVSWYDAAAFCNWLSLVEGLPETELCYAPNDDGEYAAGMKIKANAGHLTGYRLPTENEWEYACRAGSSTSWSMGNAEELLPRYGWSMPHSGMRLHGVGLLRPNRFGLFDVHGNAWEWCHDALHEHDASIAVAASGEEPVDGRRARILRGGTYLNDALGVSSPTRNANFPTHRTGADGFRVARTLPRR